VSAHFSSINDTLHDKQNISKLPTMAMSMATKTSNSVFKDCILEMEDSEIAQVIQLIKSDSVNIVDLHPFFANDYNNQLFGDFQISLVNPIGHEIIRRLETEFNGFVTLTLNAGRENVELRIHESPKDCIKTKRLNIHEFVVRSIFERIVSNMKQPTNYKICYSFPRRRNLRDSFTRLCKPDDFTKLNWHDDYLLVATYILFFLFPICFSWLLFSLLSYSLFELKHPEYYKLEDNLMSPSSILLKIIWEEKGWVISFFRRLIIMCFLTYIILCYTPNYAFFQYTRYVVLYSTLSILFSRVFLTPMISILILEKRANRKPVQNIPPFCCQNFGDCVNCVTLPFNLKFWKNMIMGSEREHERKQPIRKSLKRIAIFLLSVCFLFPLLLITQSMIFFSYQTLTILWILLESEYMHTDTDDSTPSWKEVLVCPNNGLTMFSFLMLIFHILLILVFAIQSLLLGLFLNLNFCIPYLAFASVLMFYCHSYWKSLEEKYFELKRIIYDACRDRQGDNDEGDISNTPGQNETALPVVSKEVYEIIREKFLPYHTNILYFILKVLWVVAFSCGIFELVNMLHAFHITAAVQVVTTASVGIMPRVFSMVALKISKEKDKAWNEKLKLNVKYILEGLIGMNEVRAKTVLIIQDNDDTIAGNLIICTKFKAGRNEANTVYERIPIPI
jgi:hypothetical protein